MENRIVDGCLENGCRDGISLLLHYDVVVLSAFLKKKRDVANTP